MKPGSGAGAEPPARESIFLSLIIPAYNEEERLPAAIDHVLEFVKSQDDPIEVLIVENGSSDRTWEIAAAAAERYEWIRALRVPTAGKGKAVQRGMLEAAGSFRFFCDADFSMPLEEVNHFLPPRLEAADVAIGSRSAKGAQRIDEPGYRHVMGRVFNRCIQTLLLPGIEDTQCGFKCFSARAAEEVFSRVTLPGFSFDVEALVIARTRGYRVTEIPIPWTYDANTRVRFLRDSIGMLLDIFKIFRQRRAGRYDD